jgi:DNA-binding CsgD family transcriptional regulator
MNDQARRAWAQARGRFGPLLRSRHEGDALEELGWAGWWLADQDLTLRARERAFRFYGEAADPAGAGRVATWLAADHFELRGDLAGAHLWLRRAQDAFEGQAESADHAWLMLVQAELLHHLERDLPAVLALSRSASALGRAFSVIDIEAIGLGLEGLALAGLGAVADARPALDAAAAIVATEPVRMPFTASWTLDCGVRAFDAAGDLDRLARWCEAARVAAGRSGAPHLIAHSRIGFGGLLTLTGDWPGAERELGHAVRDLRRLRPGLTGPAYARLGELRLCQGREREARALLELAGVHGLAGAGRLALTADDVLTATECAERMLDRLPRDATLDRLPALELLVRARLRAGDPEAAQARFATAQPAAAACGTPFATGSSRLLASELAMGRRELRAARDAARDAVDAFEAAQAPYHAARARVALAAALAAQGRARPAEAERAAASRIFEALGALGDRERLRLPPPLALAGLTTREAQILRLIAGGRTDADVAQHLSLSPSTVQRNLVSLRAKLRLPSRAAACAYAARAGLI